MKLSVYEIKVSPPGSLTARGIGWSEVLIQLEDCELHVLPSITVNIHVPYKQKRLVAQRVGRG
jgi:hypothetical protein